MSYQAEFLEPEIEIATSGPWVIVLGNEKGGTGKSTLAMHLAVALLDRGHSVACLDLDAQQGTLSHYLANRRRALEREPLNLALPQLHVLVPKATNAASTEAAAETEAFHAALSRFQDREFLIIDTPGAHRHLSSLAHGQADTLITPINDSLLDIEALAEVDLTSRQVRSPSGYTRMVWKQFEGRVGAGRNPTDWIVLRNRLSHIRSRHKIELADLLEGLARRIGFRLAGGLGERVIYRELFRRGLTVFDLPGLVGPRGLTESQQAAMDEVVGLVQEIGLFSGVRPLHDEDESEIGNIWRIKCHKEYLAEACRFAGLDPRAAMLQDNVDPHDRHQDDYFVEFPSPYCRTRAEFVYLLADLSRRGVNFELVVRQVEPETNRTLHYTRLYPRLSQHTLDLLWQIDPPKAAAIAETGERIEAVFERMRKELSLGPAPHLSEELNF